MTAADDPRPTVLLTGFGPFPGIRINASTTLIEALAREAQAALPDYRFVTAILPTEWARAPSLATGLHEEHVPILTLHFGVAEGAQGFQIETLGRNACRASPDAAGNLPKAARLIDEGFDRRPVTIPAAEIARELAAKGIPVSLSDDAGGYLCNAVLYHSLAHAECSAKSCSVGFIHIPADLSRPPLKLAEAVSGALEIVKLALQRADGTRPLTPA